MAFKHCRKFQPAEYGARALQTDIQTTGAELGKLLQMLTMRAEKKAFVSHYETRNVGRCPK